MNLDVRFATQLARALLPLFTRKDGPCLIMNIGSMGTAGVPYAVPYGGANTFLMSMSNSLDAEMRVEGKRIEVLAIPVGKVTGTGLNNKDPVSFFMPDARTLTRAALARVGCGRAEVVEYVGHAMQQFVFDALPAWARESVLVPVMERYEEEYLRNK